MHRPTPFLAQLLLAAFTLGAAATPLAAQGTPIGFPEEFALAADRSQALEQLIPGTEDYYYYQCRHRLNTGAFGEVQALLGPWIQRYGRTPAVVEIENRQALLTYGRDPAATLAFLKTRLGLTFDHQRQVSGDQQDLGTTLDPALLAPAALTRRALERHPRTVDGFRDSAFPFLVASDLDKDLLMSLLGRLRRPDLPNLPALVVRNLDHARSRGFGSLAIHGNLLLAQLDECVRLRPKLIDDKAFIDAYLRRLQPTPDVDWRRSASARGAYLDRLQAFVQRLAPAHNSLKAHVLNHRLRHDLALGTPDKERLLAYLRLPRSASYVNPEYLRRRSRSGEVVNTKAEFPTELGRIGNDEPLVRAYLAHFFVDEDGFEPYAETVRREYLRRLFAETKILAGAGDMERWYSMLNDPAYYEALKERVEIEFPPTQRIWFGAAEPVAIEVDIKNVATLLVKVFEINTFNYYSETGKEVDASISIDGLIANHEATHSYSENPLRRVRRSFALDALSRPGVYIVELIGNGMSSRAVIHKGRLQYVERPGAAGHVFGILDETGQQLRDASAWFGGREYTADKNGKILIPYSTKPGSQVLVLRHGNLSTLQRFAHRAEEYRLTAGIYVDRESLLPRRKASILVRPTLLLNDRPVSLELLEEPRLTITARDQSGVTSTQDLTDFQLFADRESVHEIQVPEGLSILTVTLSGRVKNLSAGKTVDLACVPKRFPINGIEATASTACPLLGHTAVGYVLDVLGKDGEPRPNRPVQLSLALRDYTDPLTVTLKTDARGRIRLGRLEGVTAVQTAGFPDGVGGWWLRTGARTYPDRLHGVAGETVAVPYQGTAEVLERSVVSLLELRGGAFTRDAFDHVALDGGFLTLRDLAPGDYHLWLKEADRHIAVEITAGTRRDGWAIGEDRMLEVDAPPLHVAALMVDGDDLRVQLANASNSARVHVVATRFLAPFDPFGFLSAPRAPAPSEVAIDHPESSYHSGREIGDEYRYILDRRLAAKYPGNMLQRPGLILNPWAVDDAWNTAIGLGGGAGGKFGGRGGARRRGRGGEGRPGASKRGPAPGIFPNLAFLPDPGIVLANLRPDADGVVSVPLADLGTGQQIHVLAADMATTVYTTLVRAETPLAPSSRRLLTGLDPTQHFAEKRRIEFLDAGATAVLEDIATSKVETYDSLAAVYQLFQTLSASGDLAEFAFVLTWPELTAEAKREHYSRHACHELNFFLHEKDPAFFADVIRPYLANKTHKTFLDHWLLGDDLSAYVDPWAFGRLNVVERILLAQHLPAQAEGVKRHVGELLDLQPPDLAQLGLLFESALKSDALKTEGGVRDKLARVQERFRRERKAKDMAPPAAAAKAPAPERAAMEPTEEAEVLKEADKDAIEDKRAEGLVVDREGELREDLARRAGVRGLYRAPEPTRQYVEHNYWHRRIEEQNADLVTVNAFWRDYALAADDAQFFSTNTAAAAARGVFAEMMFALSVLDLPFQAGEHETGIDGSRFSLRAASPLLLVRKELVPVSPAADEVPILVSQNLFRLDQRYVFEGNERRDAYVTDEFLVDVAYGCQVVVTNPTSTPRKLELLLQIPQGAIPVQKGFYTRGVSVALDPYATSSFEYAFYFPAPGTLPHYPVHVTSAGELIAFAEPRNLNVVTEPTRVDTTSWEHVSQNGTSQEVLGYLDSANLFRTDLTRIAWRMRDREFFATTIERLHSRLAYNDVLWSYGILHGATPVIREYLRHRNGFLAACGSYLDSPIATIDPIERRTWQHIEYEPVFNPRAHRFGKRRQILNRDLAGQYLALLHILGDRPQLDDADWMGVTYYLLLQDRVEEALASFAKVDPAQLPMRLQYDYMRAYLDFYTDAIADARSIAERYRDHPVQRWRARFTEILDQLDEVDGGAVAISDPENRAQQQAALAAAQPALELDVEARRVGLRYRNLERCYINYYEMDVEFLFSTHPFVQQGSGSFAYIRPNRTDTRALNADQTELAFDLPGEFQNSNVLVEVSGGGITRRQAYYANSLSVQMMENHGQLQVAHADTGKLLPKVYVKVFARVPGGRVRFHKDGYTDLRGRFDYASLSGEGALNVNRYAILVLSEADGAIIAEVAPPTQ